MPWSIDLAVLLGAVAMLRDPGGTPPDRATSGCSPTHDVLTDLGMTMGHDDRSNRLALAALVVGA